MVIWGGLVGANSPVGDGARYDPANDTWTSITTNGAPAPRYDYSTVWTGNEMIIWGGRGNFGSSGLSSDGARYNPTNDTWTMLSNVGSPSARAAQTAVWTGKEMIVWGGVSNSAPYWMNTGGRYDPSSDTWSIVTTGGAPIPRQGHSAIWTGSEMIIFGGYNNDTFFGDTYAYSPSRVMYLFLRP
jgi:N-acetylneuraminic acid mutarotase